MKKLQKVKKEKEVELRQKQLEAQAKAQAEFNKEFRKALRRLYSLDAGRFVIDQIIAATGVFAGRQVVYDRGKDGVSYEASQSESYDHFEGRSKIGRLLVSHLSAQAGEELQWIPFPKKEADASDEDIDADEAEDIVGEGQPR